MTENTGVLLQTPIAAISNATIAEDNDASSIISDNESSASLNDEPDPLSYGEEIPLVPPENSHLTEPKSLVSMVSLLHIILNTISS